MTHDLWNQPISTSPSLDRVPTPWQDFLTLYKAKSPVAETVSAERWLRERLRAAAKNKFVLNVMKKVPGSFSNFYDKVRREKMSMRLRDLATNEILLTNTFEIERRQCRRSEEDPRELLAFVVWTKGWVKRGP